ncbi:unnamed protein product [Victoria cruziana]
MEESSSASDLEEPFRLCGEMELLEFPDKYVIRPTDSQSLPPFCIDRYDGVIRPLEDLPNEDPLKTQTIFGIVGTIRLLAGTYVLVITSRKQVGTYCGCHIFQATSMKFISCNEALKLSSYQEKRDEAYFMTLLKTVELTPGLYYSYEVDLTVNLQRKYRLAEKSVSKPLWKQADPRYVWNKSLMEDLIEAKLDAFIVPLVQGSFQRIEFTHKNSPIVITTISRRCTRRLGTRMWRRGANLEGDTANFIETEQIVEFDGLVAAYMQIRGSIPLLWEQIVDLSYKPRLNIINHVETSNVVERHFVDLAQRYGSVLVIDLTDKNGDEGKLSVAFETELKKLTHVRYVSFDFHHICQRENFDNLQILYDQVAEDVEDQGYFLATSGKVIAEQKGVIRTNCIDCLDRTNVTQCFIAEKILNLQLQRMGAPLSTDTEHIDMLEKFKISWVEQGDDVSLQYAGSHALKRDVVRYGKQTLPGLISDGFNALSRYYLNNFHDGVRQVCFYRKNIIFFPCLLTNCF